MKPHVKYILLLSIILLLMNYVTHGSLATTIQNQKTREANLSKNNVNLVRKIFLPIVNSERNLTDKYPTFTRSYYIRTFYGFYNLGNALGDYAMGVNHPDAFFTYLSFGNIWRDNNGFYGTKLYDQNGTFKNITEISSAVVLLAQGFNARNTKDKLYIAVGTNNSGNTFFSIATAHGRAWAEMVKNVNQSLVQQGISQSRVTVVAGNDIEPNWNTFLDTKQWFDGYNSVTLPPPIYIIGAADGCPIYWPDPSNNMSSFIPGVCNNGWSQQDVNYISNHYSSSYSIPMNYNPNGYHALQWWRIGLWSYYSYSTSDLLTFSGAMTQEAACEQIKQETGNPDACEGMDNSMYFGFQQFRNQVVGEYRMNPILSWAADMKYYEGNP